MSWTAELPGRFRRFDVVRVDVEYAEHTGHKERPVAIVVIGDGPDYLGVKITSKGYHHEKGDVLLTHPESANLKNSMARCAQIIRFKPRHVRGYYGHLDSADVNLIATVMSNLSREDLLFLEAHE